MDTSVIMLGFFGAVVLFTVGLLVLLRDERCRHAEHARLVSESAQSRRHATIAARAESTAPVEMPVVKPGAFCRVPGTVGRSSSGTLLMCSSVPQARPRWREARRLSRAS
jgi:hypothetical protein